MVRTASPLTVLLILVVGLALVPAAIAAGQATSAAAPQTAGVGGGPLGSGVPDAAPDHVLWLRRGTFEPGGFVGLHHHPGALVLAVESGSLVYTVYEGEAVVTRAGTAATPGPTERLGPGTEAVLTAGDAVFEQGVVHTTRNDGSEPATVLIAALARADQPFTVFRDAATPAP